MGLVAKYPYTNFAGINLDYYIKMVNAAAAEIEDIKTELEAIKNYVKDVEVISNSYLKVSFGNGTNRQFALPSGSSYVVTLHATENGTKMQDLEVGESDIYDSEPGVIDTFFGALISGIPTIIKYEEEAMGVWVPIYVTTLGLGINFIHFWTAENTLSSPYFVNKMFQLTFETVGGTEKFKVKRLS